MYTRQHIFPYRRIAKSWHTSSIESVLSTEYPESNLANILSYPYGAVRTRNYVCRVGFTHTNVYKFSWWFGFVNIYAKRRSHNRMNTSECSRPSTFCDTTWTHIVMMKLHSRHTLSTGTLYRCKTSCGLTCQEMGLIQIMFVCNIQERIDFINKHLRTT